jgi:molecular chaperone GrpE
LAIKDQPVDVAVGDQLADSEAPHVEKSDRKKESESKKFALELEILQSELDLERRKSSDLASRMRYLQADIANLQRQSDKRVSEVRNQVKLTWILEIVSIKEDLDRAVGVARESGEKSTLLDGLLLVTSRIENILKLEAVEVIRAEVGGRFDPNVHEALAFQESEKEEQGTILTVISLGYSVDGKVIKPTMVEVARKKEGKKSAEAGKYSGNGVSKEMEIEESATQKNA